MSYCQTSDRQKSRVIGVGTLQRVGQEGFDFITAIRLDAALINHSLFGRHDQAPFFRFDDRVNSLVFQVVNSFNATPDNARCSTIGADPKPTVAVGVKRQDAALRELGVNQRLSATAVELSEAGFSAEPHHAVGALRDRAYAI